MSAPGNSTNAPPRSSSARKTSSRAWFAMRSLLLRPQWTSNLAAGRICGARTFLCSSSASVAEDPVSEIRESPSFRSFRAEELRNLKRLHHRMKSHDRSDSSRRANSICSVSPPDMHDVRPDPTLFHKLEFRSVRKLTDAESADRRLALRPQDLARRKDRQPVNKPG